ncbi:MAG: hypothetical protein ACI4KM_08840 [Oscillospiraceae bacterium]
MEIDKLIGLGFSEEFAKDLLTQIDEDFYAAITDSALYEIYAKAFGVLRELGFDEDMMIELWCDYESAFTIGADLLRRRLEELRDAVGEYWLDVLTEEYEDFGESRCFDLLTTLPSDKQWSKYIQQL